MQAHVPNLPTAEVALPSTLKDSSSPTTAATEGKKSPIILFSFTRRLMRTAVR